MGRRSRDDHDLARSARGGPARRAASRILLAEDDDAMRALLAQSLRDRGYDVSESHDGMDVLARLASDEPEEFDLIVSDIRMPGVTGLEFLEGLHDREGFPPTILITGFGDAAVHAEAARLGAVAVFDKPFEIDDLLAAVRKVLSVPRPDG
jgi:two-component system response regulator (stage 0 sporulation protein F)